MSFVSPETLLTTIRQSFLKNILFIKNFKSKYFNENILIFLDIMHKKVRNLVIHYVAQLGTFEGLFEMAATF